VDYPLFRVMTQNMKENLGKYAHKIRQALLDAVKKYCGDTVTEIY